MPIEVDLLEKVRLFERLDKVERGVLAEAVRLVTFPKGHTLFREGEPGESLYVVQKGEVELFVQDLIGQKIVLREAKRGDFFGELSLLDGGPRTATGLVAEDCELIEVDRDQIEKLFRTKPEAAMEMLAGLGSMTRNANAMLRKRVSRNVNEEIGREATALERIADLIAAFSGKMPFLIGNAIWFGGWILGHAAGILTFDPYPYGLLTMIVSLEAIFLSCFILIAANRQAEKDRVRADIEYEVNIKAELEVAHLHEKTDRTREELLERLARLEKVLGAPGRVQPAGGISGTYERAPGTVKTQ